MYSEAGVLEFEGELSRGKSMLKGFPFCSVFCHVSFALSLFITMTFHYSIFVLFGFGFVFRVDEGRKMKSK